MPLHPVVANLMAQAKAAGRPSFSAGDPQQARAVMSGARTALGRGPDLPRVDEVAIRTRSGTIPGRLLVPNDAPSGLVVYLHGGGWVVGDIDDFDAVGRLLALRSACAVLLVDYRLAPETPYPGPADDAEDALIWASREGSRLLGGERPLVIAGDSAGANLAAVTAATSGVPLALQVLIYPVTDQDFDTQSYLDPANAGVLTREDMIWFFDHYAPDRRRDDSRLNPLRRPDLTGLPPALVVTAQYDVLRDEGEAYAKRLREAGVPTTSKRCDGLPHGFIRMHNLVDTVDIAVQDIADAIRAACRPGGDAPGP